MQMTIPEILRQLEIWGCYVRIDVAKDSSPALVAYARKDRPLRQTEVKNLMALVRKNEAAFIRYLTAAPMVAPQPEESPALAAELIAKLEASWDGGLANALDVYRLNVALAHAGTPGCEFTDAAGTPWAQHYLEAQQS